MSEIITLEEAMKNDLLFEMVNIRSRRTGLPYDLWLDSSGLNRSTQHNMPRLKVNVDGNLIPVEISDNPKIPASVNISKKIPNKELVLRYVEAYKDILLAHFNNEIDDKDALDLLGPLSKAKEQSLKLSDLVITTPQCVAKFHYNIEELLYEVEVYHENRLLAVSYVMTIADVISKIDEFKKEFNIVEVIDEDQVIPEITITEF